MFQAPFKPRRIFCAPPTHFTVVRGDNAFQSEGYAKFHTDPLGNQQRLAESWWKAANEITRLGHRLLIPGLDAEAPDQVFGADGVMHFIDTQERRCVLLSHMNSPVRQFEVIAAEKLFRSKGYIVYRADEKYKHEGTGDALYAQDIGAIFMGYGPRTDCKAGQHLADISGKTVFALPLTAEFIEDRYVGEAGGLRSKNVEGFHLDVLAQPLPTGHVISYWKGLPYSAQKGIGLFYENLYNAEKHQLDSRIIKINEDDYNKFATNCLALPDRDAPNGYTLFVPEDISHELKNNLAGLGYRLFGVDIEVARWSGGGLHCMFNVEYDFSSRPTRKLNYVEEGMIDVWTNPVTDLDEKKQRALPGMTIFRPIQKPESVSSAAALV